MRSPAPFRMLGRRSRRILDYRTVFITASSQLPCARSVRRSHEDTKSQRDQWSEPAAEPNPGVSLPLSSSAGLAKGIRTHGHAEPVPIIEGHVRGGAGERQVDEVVFPAHEEPWCQVDAGGCAEPMAIPRHWSIPVAVAVGVTLKAAPSAELAPTFRRYPPLQ